MVLGTPFFESAVIRKYLEETAMPHLHPADALQRARRRSWMECGSALAARAADIRVRLARPDAALGEGPYFAGESFSIVDAVFGPAFRYFDVFDAIDDFGFWRELPKVRRWRGALAIRPSVAGAAHRDYRELLRQFLLARRSALSRRMAPAGPSASG